MEVAVLGAGGFIGNHLVSYLKSKGHHVLGVDLVNPGFSKSKADEFTIGDLRNIEFVNSLQLDKCNWVFQLAADMGGAGYIFTGDNDAAIMHNSAQINLNVAEALKNSKTRLFYSSSACIYPEENQMDANNPICSEESVYPANPDSEYGWEKLFSERIFLAYARNYGLDVRIARFHNIFGPETFYNNGKEKAPAAMCRKVAMAKEDGTIEVWGSGAQTRSFLYIDECLIGIEKLMQSNVKEPINIGSDEMVSINQLAQMVIDISGKYLHIENIEGPVGVNGRCSDNQKIANLLNWQPNYPLRNGMENLYNWVKSQV